MSLAQPPKLIRARTVLPISRPPLEDGALLVQNGVIRDIGPFSQLASRHSSIEVTDLGEVIVLPGLINAHCHLDYTGMAGKIPRPASFPDWIKSILALKAHWSYSEYAASWIEGARQLIASGTTTVVDIEAVPELLPDVWRATPLRIFSLIEMTGVRSGREPQRILSEALDHIGRLPQDDSHRAGLSPHALYSTPPDLLRLIANLQRERPLPIAMHIAESAEEWRMYKDASGPLYDWLKPQRPMTDCGGRSPVQQVHSLDLLRPGFLAVHANQLAPGDAELIARSGATIVHCPRSHAYFGHAPFRFDELAAAGANICLGTDSLASVRADRRAQAHLSLWDELRLFAKNNPHLSPRQLLALVTMNPARALQIPAGSLAPDHWADLIAVEASRIEDLVESPPRIVRRMIAGQWLDNPVIA